MNQCPDCGAALTINIALASPVRSPKKRRKPHNRGRVRQTLQSAMTWKGKGADSLTEVVRERAPAVEYAQIPTRAPNRESDVAVPLRQAAYTGLMVGTGAFCLACVVVIAFAPPLPLIWPPLAGFIATWGTTVYMWWNRLRWSECTIWKTEEWTNTDLDGDGYVGKPPQDITQWWNIDDDARVLTPDDKKYAAFLCFVRLVNNAQSTGQRTGQKALRGKTLGYHYKVTDDLHREFFQLLIEHKLAEQTGSGPRLTATRREVEAAIGPPPQ